MIDFLNIFNQISQTNTMEKQNGRSLTRENTGIERTEPQDLKRLLAHRGIVAPECVGTSWGTTLHIMLRQPSIFAQLSHV